MKFLRQYIIPHNEDPKKTHFFIADFYCAKARLIVEIDGGYHEEQEDYDLYREGVLLRKGFRVIRFKNEEVLEDWEGVERRLEVALGL